MMQKINIGGKGPLAFTRSPLSSLLVALLSLLLLYPFFAGSVMARACWDICSSAILLSVPMPQGGTVFRQLSAGKKEDQVRGDMRDPLQPHIGFSLRPLADDKGHDQAPLWGKKAPQTQALP
jgi:hypothetical protein